MTRKVAVFGLLGLAGVLLAMAVRNFQVMAMSLAVLAFVLAALFRRPASLTVSRDPAVTRMFEGDSRRTGLLIQNMGGTTSGLLETYDMVSDRFRMQTGRNRALAILPPGSALRLKYTLEAPLRGNHRVGPVSVRERDVLGFRRFETVLDSTEEVAVLPYAEKVEDFASGSRRVRPFPGPKLCKQPGGGMDFFGIRDYIKGDPLRRINWKLLAKRRELMVNEFEKEALSDVLVMIDAREVGTAGTTSCNPLEYAVKGAASLVRYFIAQKDRVGLVIYGKGVEVIPQGCGGRHLDKLLAHLTYLEGNGAVTFGEAMLLVQPYLAPGTAIVMISPLEFDPTLTSKAVELWSMGHPLIILSPGPFQFETLATGKGDPKYELLRLERSNFLDTIRFYGIEIVDWTPEMTVWELIERCEHAR
jgi:uncharacterized protein (DUF58 family)